VSDAPEVYHTGHPTTEVYHTVDGVTTPVSEMIDGGTLGGGGGVSPNTYLIVKRSASIPSGAQDNHFAWDDAGTDSGTGIAPDGNPYNALLFPNGGLYFVQMVLSWDANPDGTRGVSTTFPDAWGGWGQTPELVPATPTGHLNQFVQRMVRMPADGSGFLQLAFNQTSGVTLGLDFALRVDQIG
jgi:hypothetical protein